MRDALTEAESELVRIDKDINDLRCRRVEVQRIVDDRKRVFSPVRRLPAETICEILLHALGHYTESPDSATLDSRIGPWAFGQVCGFWRKIVLSFPRIWSVLDIDTHWTEKLQSRSTELPLREIEILPELLERSKELPLTIHNFAGGKSGGPGAPFLEILLKHCCRWKKITLRVDSLTLQMLNSVKGKVPILETLLLYVSNLVIDRSLIRSGLNPQSRPREIEWRDLPVDFILDGFEIAPQLTSLTIDINSSISIPLSFPWCQLQVFVEEGGTNYPHSLILARLHNVVAFKVFGGFSYEGAIDKTIIYHPKLRHLEVHDPKILDLLALPGLESLWVGTVKCRHQEFIRILSSFIHLSRCLLHSLCLPVAKAKPDTLLLAPSLTSLELQGSSSGWDHAVSELITSLTIPRAAGLLLPTLTSLQLSLFFSDAIPDDHYNSVKQLINMVESRRYAASSQEQAVARLEVFRCNINQAYWFHGHRAQIFSPEVLRRFQVLRAGGLEVHLRVNKTML